jgi:hypothetical protein
MGRDGGTETASALDQTWRLWKRAAPGLVAMFATP